MASLNDEIRITVTPELKELVPKLTELVERLERAAERLYNTEGKDPVLPEGYVAVPAPPLLDRPWPLAFVEEEVGSRPEPVPPIEEAARLRERFRFVLVANCGSMTMERFEAVLDALMEATRGG
jgi:hypothetical protein